MNTNKFVIIAVSFWMFFCLTDTGFAQQSNQGPLPSKQKKRQPGSVSPPIQVAKTINGKSSSSSSKQLKKYRPIYNFQRASNSKQKGRVPSFDVSYDPDNGQPIFMEVDYDYRQNTESVEEAVHEFLKDASRYMPVDDAPSEFAISSIDKDKLGHVHVRLHQELNGIPVQGAEIIVHFRPSGKTVMNGRYSYTPELDDFQPSLNRKTAIKQAKKQAKKDAKYNPAPIDQHSDLFDMNKAKANLAIYPQKGPVLSDRLSWTITVRPNWLERWRYVIDASNGQLLDKWNKTCTAGPATANATDLKGQTRTINVYEQGTTYYMLDGSRPMFDNQQSQIPDQPVGGILTLDANNTPVGQPQLFQFTSTSNNWPDASSVSAHYNAAQSYEYYKNTHNRNSLNGQGGTIFSVVHVTDQNSASLGNAFWTGEFIAYGDGGNNYSPWAGALDIAGHEMTHGVIENTANLEYQDESGAINESMADVFGAMIDRSDWTIGEDVTKTSYIPTGTLRDMKNPHNGGNSLNDPGWQPEHVNEKYTGQQDNGGVHTNSGICNHAYYLFATDITKNKAEKVYYRALTQYLVRSSQFVDLRVAVVQATQDLYGTTEVNAAKAAFDAVGITGTGNDHQDDIPPNKGESKLLVHGLSSDQNKIYIVDTGANNFSPISTTKAKRKCSVTDNGQYAVFVDLDGNIRRLTLDPSAPNETLLTNDNFWRNVAVSKDGSRLAAVSTVQDTSIYVYDFGKQKWARFYLYNPTYSQGIKTGGPLYAGAIQWDYTGENLVYDAFNKIPNGSGGQDYTYWDVGFINVWDKDNATWGSGQIEKLFTSLPQGVSLANPSFAKQSPYILTYDYYYASTNTFAVLASNIETGTTKTILQQSVLGFPTYSKSDNKIAFTAIGSGTGDTIVATVDMQNDKITSSSQPTGLVNNSKWPVWYAKGYRTGNDKDGMVVNKEGLSVYPNPVQDKVVIDLGNANNSAQKAKIKLYDLRGRTVLDRAVQLESGKIRLSLTDLPSNMYLLSVKTKQDGIQTTRLIKE